MTRAWPPFVGARFQNADGEVFVVTAYHWNRELGEFIVIKRTFAGGWECQPVTRAEWMRADYQRAR